MDYYHSRLTMIVGQTEKRETDVARDDGDDAHRIGCRRCHYLTMLVRETERSTASASICSLKQ